MKFKTPNCPSLTFSTRFLSPKQFSTKIQNFKFDFPLNFRPLNFITLCSIHFCCYENGSILLYWRNEAILAYSNEKFYKGKHIEYKLRTFLLLSAIDILNSRRRIMSTCVVSMIEPFRENFFSLIESFFGFTILEEQQVRWIKCLRKTTAALAVAWCLIDLSFSPSVMFKRAERINSQFALIQLCDSSSVSRILAIKMFFFCHELVYKISGLSRLHFPIISLSFQENKEY